MTDALGWRAKFGVLALSTNIIVEPDFYRMSVPSVTAHFARIHIRNQDLGSDAAFEALLAQVREELGHAVARVMTAEPDYMVMGMSSETFWSGVESNRQFIRQIKELSHGLGVATGAEACERGRCFRSVELVLDGSSKLIPVDEEADDQIVHPLRLRKADRAAHQALDPRP